MQFASLIIFILPSKFEYGIACGCCDKEARIWFIPFVWLTKPTGYPPLTFCMEISCNITQFLVCPYVRQPHIFICLEAVSPPPPTAIPVTRRRPALYVFLNNATTSATIQQVICLCCEIFICACNQIFSANFARFYNISQANLPFY